MYSIRTVGDNRYIVVYLNNKYRTTLYDEEITELLEFIASHDSYDIQYYLSRLICKKKAKLQDYSEIFE